MLKQFVAANLENMIVALYGRHVETEEERVAAVKLKFEWTMRLLNSTLLYFDDKGPGHRGGWKYGIKLSIAFGILFLNIYFIFFVFMRLLNSWGHESNVMTIVILTWCIQVTFSMGFLIYWQYTGYINDLFKSIHMPDDHSVYTGTRRTILRVIVFSFIVFIIAAIAFISAISLFYLHPNLKSMKSIDLQDLNLFSHPALFPLSAVVMFHGFFVWNVVLTLYVIISIVAYAELKKYNEELQLLGQGSENPDEICDELLKKFLKCVEYGKMVRNIDNVFEVYTFIMIGTNIPTTIFSLLSFLKALSKEWFVLLLIVPGIFFNLVELVGLTAVPAKLHEAIGRVENIVYSNTRLWYPYDERVYQIALVMVNHVRQANLGISLWGFAVVSKPLILTTISLTATYLILLLQLTPASTVASFNQMNATFCP